MLLNKITKEITDWTAINPTTTIFLIWLIMVGILFAVSLMK